jgi:hypothetical protein
MEKDKKNVLEKMSFNNAHSPLAPHHSDRDPRDIASHSAYAD